MLSPIKEIPNTGNLSNDVLILLKTIAYPFKIIGDETIHGLMVEHLGEHHPGTDI